LARLAAVAVTAATAMAMIMVDGQINYEEPMTMTAAPAAWDEHNTLTW